MQLFRASAPKQKPSPRQRLRELLSEGNLPEAYIQTMFQRIGSPPPACSVEDLRELAGDEDATVRRNAMQVLFDRRQEFGDPRKYVTELTTGFLLLMQRHESGTRRDIHVRFDAFRMLLTQAPEGMDLSPFLPFLLQNTFYAYDSSGTSGTRAELEEGAGLVVAAARMGVDLSPIVEKALAWTMLMAPGERVTRLDLGCQEMMDMGREILTHLTNASSAVPLLLRALRAGERIDQEGKVYGNWPSHIGATVEAGLIRMSERGWLETRRALRQGIAELRASEWMHQTHQGEAKETYDLVVKALAQIEANLA